MTRTPHRTGMLGVGTIATSSSGYLQGQRELQNEVITVAVADPVTERAEAVAFANGVGVDDDEIRTGNAMILDPYGRILSETWAAANAIVVADLDPALLDQSIGHLWIAARRPELYGLLAQPTGRERDAREPKFEE